MQKTLFIIISRSFIIRNILRSGTLDLLKKSGHKIIIFFPAKETPQYLRDEFEDGQVKLFSISIIANSVLTRFSRLINYLIYTKTTKERVLYHLGRSGFPRAHFRLLLLNIISRIPFARPLFRWLEYYIFPEHNESIKNYFNEYKPDLVFSTSIISSVDIAFLKEAKRRGVKTVSMPKSWDNLTNMYYRFTPDYFLSPNLLFKEILPRLQQVPEERIFVVGMPQFDWYTRKEILRTREEHFKRKTLNPEKALLFFGSEGSWTPNEYEVVEMIYNWVVNEELVRPCQLLIRPHYSNVRDNVFKNLRGKERVVIDDYRIVDFMADKWDLNFEEIVDFTNSVVHCDVLINPASTLSLDAVCAGRPVINLAFGCIFDNKGKDITVEKLYSVNNMEWVIDTGAAPKAESPEELKEKINHYLLNPKSDEEKRDILLKKLCFKTDGLSHQRVADAINNILSE